MPRVALRKESVDRNIRISLEFDLPLQSLSARRAWIEIASAGIAEAMAEVALRKESVDRNYGRFRAIQHPQMSLSARRAWIEMVTVSL